MITLKFVKISQEPKHISLCKVWLIFIMCMACIFFTLQCFGFFQCGKMKMERNLMSDFQIWTLVPTCKNYFLEQFLWLIFSSINGYIFHNMDVCVKWFNHVQLYKPMDCSPSIHGILQARVLGWVAIPFSSVSS